MKSNYTFSTILLMLMVFTGYSQQNTDIQATKTVYYYSFNATTDTPVLTKVENEVKSLKGVTEVKIKFKPENKIGQLIVVVKEKPRKSEGDIMFQPTDLKRILITNGFIPDELETGKVIN